MSGFKTGAHGQTSNYEEATTRFLLNSKECVFWQKPKLQGRRRETWCLQNSWQRRKKA